MTQPALHSDGTSAGGLPGTAARRLFHLLRARGKRGALKLALHGALLLFCAATSVAVGSMLEH